MSHGSMALTYQQLSLGHSIVSRRDRRCEKCAVSDDDEDTVRVRSPQLDTLRRVLTDAGLKADTDEGSALLVHGAAIEVIGDLAARNAITLHELSAPQASLEEAYMKLTDEATEYRSVSQ